MTLMPWKWYLQWFIMWPVVLGHGVMPLMLAVFFCRFCQTPVKWSRCGVYMVLSDLLVLGEYRLGMTGSPGLALEMLLLALWGKVCIKKSHGRTVAAAVLLLSVCGAVSGIISWTEQRLFFPVVVAEPVIYLWDGLRELAKTACMLVVLTLMLKKFGQVIEEADERILVWLAVPVLFLSMVERIIRNSVYGDTLVADTVSGQVRAVIDINHGEMLVLQVFACLCLFLTMVACKKITVILREAERTRLLKQQIKAQEIYVQEAEARLGQTRGFRHDISNHLMVLSELLKKNQTEEAAEYLEKLEQVSSGLSMEVHTGNAAVSALLGSKISSARQKDIQVRCDLALPKPNPIEDMDWCILFSNGMDNAIRACESLPKESRHIRIKSHTKGNFYLVTLENSCKRELKNPPPDGTGLSNIRATAKKYKGRVENRVSDGVYQLRLLFTTETGHFTAEP